MAFSELLELPNQDFVHKRDNLVDFVDAELKKILGRLCVLGVDAPSVQL